MRSAHYLNEDNTFNDLFINTKDRYSSRYTAPHLSENSNVLQFRDNLSRGLSRERREQHIISHLYRLEELNLERISLLKEKLRYQFEIERNVIMTENHKEAAKRTFALECRLHELLRQHAPNYYQHEGQQNTSSSTKTIAFYILSSLVNADSSHAEVECELINKIFSSVLKKNINENDNHSISILSFMKTLIGWIRLHYMTRYAIQFYPLSSRVAMMRLAHFMDDKWENNKQLYQTINQRQQKERFKSREERKKQRKILEERLYKAQRNAFEVRKRIFLFHELLQDHNDLPNSEHLDPVKCAEVLQLIRKDLKDGDIHFLLQLSADNGNSLKKIVQ
ncbi:copper-transporting ATPase-like protein [Trypanosoma theileri]|uniref:Copper-transporting ATPase-like protein n=1 Tax=Trypanosoma theileri TaxID=67003 RepID=A0A1X0P3Y7_9TRYP|nr:copper-transporting ATPase-like protein [Trypanosoma theileri]ORC91647.1 copper-transporting ATPase-like protein [Trypanosoma theileri]